MQKIKFINKKLPTVVKEEMNTLRTNVEFSGEDIKVIAVTSCLENEGKSTVSRRMAMSFAEEGKKTLLIDADLRKSIMRSHIEEGEVKLGLTNYLVGKEKMTDVLTATENPNLFVIFAGYVPPNPSELLNNNYFKNLIEAARSTFDMVIIDTPPVGEVIDAAIIASKCDGAIVVMKHASITYQFARRIKDQLEASGVRVLGCVLNKIGEGGNSFYGKYYGKYYRKYGNGYYKGYYRYGKYGYGKYGYGKYGSGKSAYGYGYGYGHYGNTYGKVYGQVYGEKPVIEETETESNNAKDNKD